ncbi:hypothetical protein SpAn4DRAFT_5244 [Sporomusa ovata]|uniref:Uncharacterized protein n=1 Tax=Sporomusa ovata TaxID=2378 RepID=A0A0U1KYI9_9FIRM|nr:hypothetical protein SpAn4DRAFT_5244 [Sporomusa ovata]
MQLTGVLTPVNCPRWSIDNMSAQKSLPQKRQALSADSYC